MGKKRHKKTLEMKKIRRMVKEYNTLFEQRRKLPKIKLETPIFKGYTKTYRLKREYAEGPDRDKWEFILFLCNNTVFSKNKNFIEKMYIKGKGMIKETITLQPSPSLLKDIPENYRKYFRYNSVYVKESFIGSFRYQRENWIHGYFPTQMFFAEEVRRKYYQTHITQIDPELESKLKKLNDFLWDQNYNKYMRAMDWSRHWDDWNLNKLVVSERVRKKELEELRKEYC